MLYEYSFGDFYLRHASDDEPDDRNFSMHIHEMCEIYFFISGDVKYLVEGSEYMLEENSLLILRPAEAHNPKILSQKKYERFAINFPIRFAESIDPCGRLTRMFIDKQLGKNNLFRCTEIDTKLIKKLFSKMCEEMEDYEKQLTIKTHLLFILDTLTRAYTAKSRLEYSTPSVAERIVTYVNAHLFEDISVPVIAKHFYLSPSQFSRVFKQATGATPWEYITKKRLTAAKEKIAAGTPARLVAEECGFGDYSAFYRAFTKHFSTFPTSDENIVRAK